MTRREIPEPVMQALPTREHEWLRPWVGEWRYEGEARMAPTDTAMTFTGVEKVRSLNGLWYIAESEGPMPDGSTATMILTLGYDPQKGHYVGTWIGSMMTWLWSYEGRVDPAGKALILESVGPNMALPGTTAQFQDIHEWQDNDHRTLTSRMLDQHGQWQTLMTARYSRAH